MLIMWYNSEGILKCYPWGDWWAILTCCDDLVSYYRKMAERKLGFKLNKPKHGSHITVFRGEGLRKNKKSWLSNDKKLMCFSYNNEITFGETHVWLPVKSESLMWLRLNFGLSEQPEYGFHLTLGKY